MDWEKATAKLKSPANEIVSQELFKLVIFEYVVNLTAAILLPGIIGVGYL